MLPKTTPLNGADLRLLSDDRFQAHSATALRTLMHAGPGVQPLLHHFKRLKQVLLGEFYSAVENVLLVVENTWSDDSSCWHGGRYVAVAAPVGPVLPRLLPSHFALPLHPAPCVRDVPSGGGILCGAAGAAAMQH